MCQDGQYSGKVVRAVAEHRTGAWVWLIPLLLLAAVFIGIAGWGTLGWFTERPSETRAPLEPAPGRPDNPSLPPDAEPVSPGAVQGQPGGQLTNVYSGSEITSADLARAVGEEYLAHYRDTGELEAVLDVYSPVSEASYEMTCTDNGAYVVCHGGYGLLVYIS